MLRKTSYKEIMNFEAPYIHLFKNSLGYYLFDVNTVKVLKIPKYLYLDLYHNPCDTRDWDKDSIDYMTSLKKDGYLSNHRVKESEHPLTEFLDDLVNHKLSHITLQITQNCNLRCEYCVYSGEYRNRIHSNERMNCNTMRDAVDYLIRCSSDADRMAISFYGGEPLLEFALIQECVEYALMKTEGRKVTFNFTTNGTLLTKEKLEFLVHHDFRITISLDGPEFIHDKHRKLAYTSKGSFDKIIENLEYIYDAYPEFYQSNIQFNTVIDPLNRFTIINDFIRNNKLLKQSMFSSTLIDDTYAINDISHDDQFDEEFRYELFKIFLWKTGWLSREDISPLLVSYYGSLKKLAKMIETMKRDRIPEKFNRGGPCVPGIQRLFVTATGELYPCERVSESSPVARLGDIDSGISLERAERILNVEQETSEMCRNCWAYYFCTACIAKMDDGTRISTTKLSEQCNAMRSSVESELSDYVVMKELGYQWELDA